MENTTNQKFFLYARKSTDVEDKQILSIEAQLTELREYVKREDIYVLEELIEKQSAKIPGRPIFNSMVERIEKGEANGIVSWNPDRLARNSIDGGRIIYLIDTGKLESLKFPTFWFEPTPQGKFMLSISFSQSKYYVDSLSENTKRGLRQKVRRGEYPRLAPVGYINNRYTKRIDVNKREAPLIKKAFEMFSTGSFRILDINNFLAKNGITSRNGKPRQADWVTKQILTNPFYYGHFRWKDEIFEGIHEPLISKKLFDEVQQVVARRSKIITKEKLHKPYLGLLRCKNCSMMITAEIQKDHIYYRCTRKSKTISCNEPFIRQEDLDNQLSDMIQTVSLRRDWANKMINKMKEEEKDVTQSLLSFVENKKEIILQINRRLKNLLDAYLDQDIDRNDYLNKKAELLNEKKNLEEQIHNFQQTQNSWLEPMRRWLMEAAGVADIAQGDDFDSKKELVKKIFGSNLYLSNKMVAGEALNPWAALRAAATTRGWVPRVRVELT